MVKQRGVKPEFAAAINCIDGRIQVPVMNFIKDNYGVDYIDMITVPGPDRVLSESEDMYEIESIKKKVLISFKKHDSRLIFIIGHYDCAGNPCAEKRYSAARTQRKKNVFAVNRTHISSATILMISKWLKMQAPIQYLS